MLEIDKIINQTKNWIKTVVIGCNFCPFAARVFLENTIHYIVSDANAVPECINVLSEQFFFLETNKQIETTLIIIPAGFHDFEKYLKLVQASQKYLQKNGYEGVYQIASFHPDYYFNGAEENDPANYTNRSIYPMLHILREQSITKALAHYPNSLSIPDNNIAFAQKKGLHFMKMLLANATG